MKSSPFINKFFKLISLDVLLSEGAYSDELTYKWSSNPLLKDYELLFLTDYLKDVSNLYRASVFVNHKTKTFVIATSGSRGCTWKAFFADILDNFLFVIGSVPYKVQEIQKINQILLDALGREVASYKIHFTGHSLGGLLSDCGALHMHFSLTKLGLDVGDKQITSTTFENPGSDGLMKKLCSSYGHIYDGSFRKNFITFNNGRNFVNSWNKPFGKVLTVRLVNQKHPFLEYKDWVFKKLSDNLGFFKSTLSFFSDQLSKLYNVSFLSVPSEHALENFKEIFLYNREFRFDKDDELLTLISGLAEEGAEHPA